MVKKSCFDPQWVLDTMSVNADLRERLQQEAEKVARNARLRAARRGRALLRKGAEAKPVPPVQAAAVPPPEPPTWPHLVAWQLSQVELLSSDANARFADRDFIGRIKKAVERMQKAGPWRRLVTLPEDWRMRVEDLRTRFPNFGDVVDYVAAACAVAEQRDRVVRFGHILISGAPGIGKSLFVEALAQSFSLPWHRIDMASAQSSARLAGSDEYWSNTKPGLLFEILAFGVDNAAANTLVVLDELEKASSNGVHDPIGALYSLLEPASARNFTDLSFPSIVLDASGVLFIGTVNQPERVAEPIRSRMRHFAVAAPNAEQSRKIIERIYAEAAAELNMRAGVLPANVVDLLVRFSPRRVKQLLMEAFGRALLAGRRGALEVGDIPAARAPAAVPTPKVAPIILIKAYRDEPDEHSIRVFH